MTQLEQIQQFVKDTQDYISWDTHFHPTIEKVGAYLAGETDELPQITTQYCYYFYRLFELLGHHAHWGELQERIFRFITQPICWENPTSHYEGFANQIFNYFNTLLYNLDEENKQGFRQMVEMLRKNGITNDNILSRIIMNNYHNLLRNGDEATAAGDLVRSFSDDDIMLSVKKIVASNYNYYTDSLVRLLFSTRRDLIVNNIHVFIPITTNYYNKKEVATHTVIYLLSQDAKFFAPFVEKWLSQIDASNVVYTLQQQLIKDLPEIYKPQELTFAHHYLEIVGAEIKDYASGTTRYFHEGSEWDNISSNYIPYSALALGVILEKGEANLAKLEIKETPAQYAARFIENYGKMPIDEHTLSVIHKHLGQKSLPILMSAFDCNATKAGNNYFKHLFSLISTLEHSEYEEKLWALAKNKAKKVRESLAVFLAKRGESVIERANALLSEKTADLRQTGALILSKIDSQKVKDLLKDVVDSERNDETRELIIESLGEKFIFPQNETETLAAISAAKNRGKLDKVLTSWLDEEKLPAVYWKKSGNALDKDAIRFILYRQSRVKEMRSDAEAKALIQLVDRETSGAFAKYVLEAYLDNSQDPKYKYFLSIAGLLGDDELTEKLRATINKWADNNRGKMAEYGVQALALVGTNKALRMIEQFSRKYRNKNKNIGAAAEAAFVIAAEELNITPFELADRIIPDFGFEGLFKNFEVKGKEYRAFIDNDFKLSYFDEDNKKTKTPPKGTAKELQDAFKAIAKEVRDIVKSQSGRMEQYLVTQRKWTKTDWESFFLGNPIMFVYALKLVWGVYDNDGNLQFSFRVQDDMTFIDSEYEELELPENEEIKIGMVHPLSLEEDTKNRWAEMLEDEGMEQLFAQMKRPVIVLPESEKALKMTDKFENIDLDGKGFRGQVEKWGWRRGSVVDGGMISSYRKLFPDVGIEAVIEVEGIYVGFYDDYDPKMGKLCFIKIGTAKTGSYTYNEPSNANDERLVPFGKVPAIIYSEVMAELNTFYKEPENPEVFDENNAYSYQKRATKRKQLGDEEGALEDLNKAIQLKGDDFMLYFTRAEMLKGMKKYQEAFEDYEKTLFLNPENTDALFYAGYVAGFYLKQHETGIQYFRQYFELKKDVSSQYNIGILYYNSGNYEKAIEEFNATLKLSPEYVDAHLLKADAYGLWGKYDEAIEGYEKTLKLRPNYVKAVLNMAWALGKKKEWENCFKGFERAIALSPDYALIYSDRGEFYLELGEKEKAKADFEKVLELEPDNEKVKKYLAKM